MTNQPITVGSNIHKARTRGAAIRATWLRRLGVIVNFIILGVVRMHFALKFRYLPPAVALKITVQVRLSRLGHTDIDLTKLDAA